MKEEYDLKGTIRSNSNIMCEMMITSDNEELHNQVKNIKAEYKEKEFNIEWKYKSKIKSLEKENNHLHKIIDKFYETVDKFLVALIFPIRFVMKFIYKMAKSHITNTITAFFHYFAIILHKFIAHNNIIVTMCIFQILSYFYSSIYYFLYKRCFYIIIISNFN